MVTAFGDVAAARALPEAGGARRVEERWARRRTAVAEGVANLAVVAVSF